MPKRLTRTLGQRRDGLQFADRHAPSIDAADAARNEGRRPGDPAPKACGRCGARTAGRSRCRGCEKAFAKACAELGHSPAALLAWGRTMVELLRIGGGRADVRVSVTAADLAERFVEQGGRCPVSGAPIIATMAGDIRAATPVRRDPTAPFTAANTALAARVVAATMTRGERDANQ